MNWLLYAILGAVLAGASPVFAKSGMRKSNSHLAAALRGTLLFVGALFMVNEAGSGMNLSAIGSTTFMYLIFSGIATGLVWICFVRALQLGEVIKVVPIIEGSIAIDLLVGIFIFHDEVSWNKIVIIAIILGEFVTYKILKSKQTYNAEIISIIFLVILLFSFILYTFYPPQIPLFQDPISGNYGYMT